MMKRILLLSIASMMLLTGCALVGGGKYRSYKRLQGVWTLDEYWTAQRADKYAKNIWGDPRRNERAKAEYDSVLEAAKGVSFIFDKKNMTVKRPEGSSTTRWQIIDYSRKDDSILIRKVGANREELKAHKNLSVQEVVDLLGVVDGDVPHILGVRFLDSRHIEFFTLKVIAGKVSDYRNARGVQVYQWNPPPKKVKQKKKKPTPMPTPTPTPEIIRPIPEPTPIPRLEVPPMVPIMELPGDGNGDL